MTGPRHAGAMSVLGRALLVSALCMAFCWWPLESAESHPGLVESSPEPGEHLVAPPERILLRFSDSVDVALSRVEVRDGEGRIRPLQMAPSTAEGAVVAELDPSGREGPWSVEYQVLGEDGHSIVGGYVFTVGSTVLPEDLRTSEHAALRWSAATLMAVALAGGTLLLRRLAR